MVPNEPNSPCQTRRGSIRSFGRFVPGLSGFIGGSEDTFTSDNVIDLGRLCAEFEFREFAKKVADWQSVHGAFGADAWRELGVLKAAMTAQRLRHGREICEVEREVELLCQASDSQREAPEPDARAVAEVRRVVGQLAGQGQDLGSENDREPLTVGEVARAGKQLRAEAARLGQQIEVLAQENRRLSEANEVVKREVREVPECCPEVKKDPTNLEGELAKLKEEMRARRPQPEPLAPPAADATYALAFVFVSTGEQENGKSKERGAGGEQIESICQNHGRNRYAAQRRRRGAVIGM